MVGPLGWLMGRDGAKARSKERSNLPEGDPVRVEAVLAVIDEIRPAVKADGGDIELVAVRGGQVEVLLKGACASCAASTLTLRGALEPRLRERLPWFQGLREL